MAANKQDKDRVKRATAAWRAITGRPPTETPDSWKVFFEAAMSAAQPTQERDEWVKQCTKHWKATIGKLKAEVYETVRALGDRTPANIRAGLSELDPAFAHLTDDQILRAMHQRSWWKAVALLALPVEALGVERHRREPEARAIDRIADDFRKAHSRHFGSSAKVHSKRA